MTSLHVGYEEERLESWCGYEQDVLAAATGIAGQATEQREVA